MFILIAYRCQPIKICNLHLASIIRLIVCATFVIIVCCIFAFAVCYNYLNVQSLCVETIMDDMLLGTDLDQTLGWNSLLHSSDYVSEYNKVPNSPNDLIIVQLNIRGIQSKLSDLKLLLNKIVTMDQPDVILLCETWLQPSIPDPQIPGYQVGRKDRLTKKRWWCVYTNIKTVKLQIKK